MKNQIRVLGSVSPYCKNGSNCPGYLFEGDVNKILLDCGPGITSLMNVPDDLNNLTIVVSHFHKDHYADLFSLGYASYCYHRMGVLNKKIKVYIPEVFPGEPGYEDYLMIINLKEQYFDICVYNENSKIEFEDVTVSFFRTKHSITNFSSKIETSGNVIVYTGDMGMIENENFISFCSNASLLISESTYLVADEVNDSNHLNAKEAAQIAFDANVDMLMLTHFWPEHNKTDYLEEACSVFSNTIVAEEGLLLDLNLSRSKICR
jgi:ribonuclease BN (tRNA processing enzyme)